MFPQLNKQVLVGALLILFGVLLLLQVVGVLGALSGLVWLLVFSVGGSVFLYMFLTAVQERWWAAIPSFVLLGVAATVLFSLVAPPEFSGMGSTIFLGSSGAGFLAVFVTNPRHWWAIIPGGTLISLAGVTALDVVWIGFLNPATVLFIGLGVTFGALGALSGYLNQNLRWAYIPAAILLIVGLILSTPFSGALTWLWPLALIALGAYFLLRQSKAFPQPRLDAPDGQFGKANAPAAPEIHKEHVLSHKEHVLSNDIRSS